MDMFQAMNAMQNPQGVMMQYAMQGMIAQHPDVGNRHKSSLMARIIMLK